MPGEVYFYGMKEELWNLELDTESNWKIVHNSAFLLEESVVPLLDGYEIVCNTKTLDKCVEIVMLEKLDCILSKRATRPYIYESTSVNACVRIYV